MKKFLLSLLAVSSFVSAQTLMCSDGLKDRIEVFLGKNPHMYSLVKKETEECYYLNNKTLYCPLGMVEQDDMYGRPSFIVYNKTDLFLGIGYWNIPKNEYKNVENASEKRGFACRENVNPMLNSQIFCISNFPLLRCRTIK